MTRVKWLVALFVVPAIAAVFFAACTDAPPAGEPAATERAAPATPQAAPQAVETFSPALVERVSGTLKSAGVEVLADAVVFEGGARAATAGFALSEFQVRNMAAEESPETPEAASGTNGLLAGCERSAVPSAPPLGLHCEAVTFF